MTRLRWLLVALAVACGSTAPKSAGSGQLVLTSPPPEARALAQPLAVVWGDAFEGRGLSVTWANLTAGTSGTARVQRDYRPCVFPLPCPPEERRVVVYFTVAIPLVPGANQLRIRAADLDGNWAYADLGLSFTPGTVGPAVHVTQTYLQEGAACLLVVGTGNELVSLTWANALTGAAGAIEGESSYAPGTLLYPTDLTGWSECVPLAAGTNAISVGGTGWNGAVVEDGTSAVWPP